MAQSLGNRVLDAIESVKQTTVHVDGERDYDYARRVREALEGVLGLRVLAMTDASSTHKRPRLNVVVWSEKGREVQNPDLRGSGRINYFYA